jgi:hypothetical protein
MFFTPASNTPKFLGGGGHSCTLAVALGRAWRSFLSTLHQQLSRVQKMNRMYVGAEWVAERTFQEPLDLIKTEVYGIWIIRYRYMYNFKPLCALFHGRKGAKLWRHSLEDKCPNVPWVSQYRTTEATLAVEILNCILTKGFFRESYCGEKRREYDGASGRKMIKSCNQHYL